MVFLKIKMHPPGVEKTLKYQDVEISKVIFSNNAKQFCLNLVISNHFSSLGHSQENGQVEVTDRIILRNLKVRLEKSKSEWVKDLPSILWAY